MTTEAAPGLVPSIIEQAIAKCEGTIFISLELGSRMRQFENSEVTLQHEGKRARVSFGQMSLGIDKEGAGLWVLPFTPVPDSAPGETG